MENSFCFDECPIGKAAVKKCLALNSSIYDAVEDFNNFTETCLKACLYNDTQK